MRECNLHLSIRTVCICFQMNSPANSPRGCYSWLTLWSMENNCPGLFYFPPLLIFLLFSHHVFVLCSLYLYFILLLFREKEKTYLAHQLTNRKCDGLWAPAFSPEHFSETCKCVSSAALGNCARSLIVNETSSLWTLYSPVWRLRFNLCSIIHSHIYTQSILFPRLM